LDEGVEDNENLRFSSFSTFKSSPPLTMGDKVEK
tara:strand:+ start:951 stop:1052 length:102 start_codon:yes stop_codon:yes gene_type:complete